MTTWSLHTMVFVDMLPSFIISCAIISESPTGVRDKRNEGVGGSLEIKTNEA